MQTIIKTPSEKTGALQTDICNPEHSACMLHELKNPVTIMSSTLQLMEKEMPELKQNSRWSRLHQELEHLTRLLNDYSAFNQRAVLHSDPVNLADLLLTTLSSFEALACQKGISLRFLKSPSLPGSFYSSYPCDSVKLREVFQNLIKNSLEAAPHGGTVTAGLRLRSQRCLGLFISNNGPAIPPEVLPHIFEPFYTTKSSGTGVGLALSNRIVAAHGGQLTVSSSPDKTCFTICLPLKNKC